MTYYILNLALGSTFSYRTRYTNGIKSQEYQYYRNIQKQVLFLWYEKKLLIQEVYFILALFFFDLL